VELVANDNGPAHDVASGTLTLPAPSLSSSASFFTGETRKRLRSRLLSAKVKVSLSGLQEPVVL
jgi:hypothetical protein